MGETLTHANPYSHNMRPALLPPLLWFMLVLISPPLLAQEGGTPPATAGANAADEGLATPDTTSVASPPVDVGITTQQQWSQALRQRYPESEALILRAGEIPFLGLLRHGERSTIEGGVILLHDQGQHPDWPGAIHQLRTQLPRYGWSTLSIEVPPLAHGDKPLPLAPPTDTPNPDKPRPPMPSDGALNQQREQLATRLQAAIATMAANNVFNLVILGHGNGAALAAHYLHTHTTNQIRGLVVVGMDGGAQPTPEQDGALLLQQVVRPILDIYGASDHNAATSAARRLSYATAAAPGRSQSHLSAAHFAGHFDPEQVRQITYRQHQISGADHELQQHGRELTKRVVGWLRRYTSGSQINQRYRETS